MHDRCNRRRRKYHQIDIHSPFCLIFFFERDSASVRAPHTHMEGQRVDDDDDDEEGDLERPHPSSQNVCDGVEVDMNASRSIHLQSPSSSATMKVKSRKKVIITVSVSTLVVLTAATLLILLLVGVFKSASSGNVSASPGRGIRFSVPGSSCLDGGPMSLFLEKKPTSKRWVIHLQGGGFCSNPQTCTERRDTNLGSCALDQSVSDPWDDLNYAILSNRAVNPFASYNKVRNVDSTVCPQRKHTLCHTRTTTTRQLNF